MRKSPLERQREREYARQLSLMPRITKELRPFVALAVSREGRCVYCRKVAILRAYLPKASVLCFDCHEGRHRGAGTACDSEVCGEVVYLTKNHWNQT